MEDTYHANGGRELDCLGSRVSIRSRSDNIPIPVITSIYHFLCDQAASTYWKCCSPTCFTLCQLRHRHRNNHSLFLKRAHFFIFRNDIHSVDKLVSDLFQFFSEEIFTQISLGASPDSAESYSSGRSRCGKGTYMIRLPRAWSRRASMTFINSKRATRTIKSCPITQPSVIIQWQVTNES